jgi:hypothetical protein
VSSPELDQNDAELTTPVTPTPDVIDPAMTAEYFTAWTEGVLLDLLAGSGDPVFPPAGDPVSSLWDYPPYPADVYTRGPAYEITFLEQICRDKGFPHTYCRRLYGY